MNASARLCALLGLAALTACKETGTSTEDVTEKPSLTREQHVQALFDSLLDGVQLIEQNEMMGKVSGPVDETASPPRYEVSYAGCVDGFMAGSFCVEDGKHVIDVVAPGVEIIRAVDQRYVLAGFGSVPDYTMTGSLYSIVEVRVDSAEHTTHVEGLASGELEVQGGIAGKVGVELEITGGRNYTESAATPILVNGTLTLDGEQYPVEGGFQRE